MKIVLQRVERAKVTIDDNINGEIGKGYLIFLGIGKNDTDEIAKRMVDKIKKLRIFEDDDGKTNLSISDVDGKVMVVSQFTLYANCKKGNRPSFIEAAPPAMAEELYKKFIDVCIDAFGDVQHGEFGADMKIELLNDGPFTLVLDSDEL